MMKSGYNNLIQNQILLLLSLSSFLPVSWPQIAIFSVNFPPLGLTFLDTKMPFFTPSGFPKMTE